MLSSCDDTKDNDDVLYYGGADAGGVYIPADAKMSVEVSENTSNYSVLIYRGSSEGELTVPVTVTPINSSVIVSAFSFSSSVTFANGALTAPLNFTVDVAMLPNNTPQQFEVQIDPKYATVYGPDNGILTVEKTGPWVSIGKGTYADFVLGTTDYSTTNEVEFYQSESNPNVFRISNPYDWDGTDPNAYFQFQVLQPGETYLGQTITMEGLVAYPDFVIDNSLEIDFPGEYSSLNNQQYWAYNYVVDYQDNGLPAVIHISPIYVENGTPYNYSDQESIEIVFPGVTVYDTVISVTYNGIMISPDNSMNVLSYVELGADVTSAKVAVVRGRASNAQILGIVDGSIESTEIRTSGDVYIPFSASNPADTYSVVAVSFYEGEAEYYSVAYFTYTGGGGETWSYVTTGTYTYLEFWEQAIGIGPEILDLYESDAIPGRYMIENWLGGVDFVFSISNNNIITVDEQPTGIIASDPQTGGSFEVYVMDLVDFAGSTNYGYGYLAQGIYNFAVVYVDDEGYYYDYGMETFVPSTARSSKAYAASSKDSKPFAKYINKKAPRHNANKRLFAKRPQGFVPRHNF